ncbi:MAG: phosphatidylglycerol lysyltransferase domain-containing protein, partial [Cellulosilyticaceae bacterium]
FNMGMTPLANVGKSKYAFATEKIAALIYTNFQFLYAFNGLRQFKCKYVDEWHVQYLAYRRKESLLFTVLQVTLLVAHAPKRNDTTN